MEKRRPLLIVEDDPALLKRSWEQTKTVMSAGAIDSLTNCASSSGL